MTKYDRNENRTDVGPHVTKSNRKRVKRAWRESGASQSLKEYARTTENGKAWLLRKGILVD